jgi:predicted RND superfamily exporter protein
MSPSSNLQQTTSRSFFQRYHLVIVLATIGLVPLIFWASGAAVRASRNDVRDWLPEDFEETTTHAWFEKRFPYEDFVLVSWEGCTLDDPRLELFAQKLENPERGPDEPWYFESVLTGQQLVRQLQSRYSNLTEEEILARLEGSLVSRDHRKTCLVVTLSKEAEGPNLRVAVRTLRDIATDECGIPDDEIRLGGPPVDNVALDYEGQRTLHRLAVLSVVFGLTIAWFCFRSVRLTLIVFASAILAASLAMASVYLGGSWLDAILMMMPSLVFVLAMSGSIHMINYYHDAIGEKATLDGAPEAAVKHAWYPCTMAALTTAIGLGSLLTSHVVPISKFGVFSAWGVLASLAVIFLLLPALLQRFPSTGRAEKARRDKGPDAKDDPFVRFWHAVGRTVIRQNRLVVVGCLAVMAFLAVGIGKIETSIDMSRFFKPEAEIVRHTKWLEKSLGPLVPMEIVVRIDNRKCDLPLVDRMRLAQHVEHAVERLPDVGGAISAATFAPDLRRRTRTVAERVLGIDRDRILSQQLDKHRAELREYLAIDHPAQGSAGSATNASPGPPGDTPKPAPDGVRRQGEELWRVTARVTALKRIDFALFAKELKTAVDPVLEAYRNAGYQGIRVTYTGLVPLVYKTQRELLRGLYNSLLCAFCLIAVIMVLVLKSPSAGLLSMIPNLFPVVIIFGTMGWIGLIVDIGLMMTATVALGVAVDDTIHYLTWFRRGLDQGLDRKGAAMLAYERCAAAMTQTTLIAGLGLAAFVFSTFAPTQRFGVLMLTLLSAALVGDLIFLPALLTGPLGRLFERRCRPVPAAEAAEEAQIASTVASSQDPAPASS